MNEIFESLMMIAFGLSWPANIIKSWKSKTAKGKSLIFLIFVFIGYICGIIAKIITNNINVPLVFYIINLLMVASDIVLYFRNSRLDNINTLNNKI